MRLTRRLGRPSFFAVCLIGAVLACSVPASAGNEVNYQDPLTAAPPIARPPTQSCSVTVMQDFAFNSSVGQGVFNGTLAPPRRARARGRRSCSTSPARSPGASSTGS